MHIGRRFLTVATADRAGRSSLDLWGGRSRHGRRRAARVQAAPPQNPTLPSGPTQHIGRAAHRPDGLYDFVFRLYDAPEGGNLLWSETQTKVDVQAGSFTTALGSSVVLPPSLSERKEGWLAVSVRGPSNRFHIALPAPTPGD